MHTIVKHSEGWKVFLSYSEKRAGIRALRNFITRTERKEQNPIRVAMFVAKAF